MRKLSLQDNSCTIWPKAGGNQEFYTFLLDISPKLNAIVQMELELTYYDVPVQHISHYSMESAKERERERKREGQTETDKATVREIEISEW